MAEGWDNVTVRVGSDLAARLPRRSDAVALLLRERRWLSTDALENLRELWGRGLRSPEWERPAWMLLPGRDERRTFWSSYGSHEPLMARARAWAVLFGVTLATTREPDHARVGRITLHRLLEEWTEGVHPT